MQTMMSRHNQNRRSSGFTLIEVLIAFVVMAAGLLALLSFHSTTQTNAAEAKTQAEATALAEAKLQELESFLDRDDLRIDASTGDGTDTPSGQLANYTRSWTVDDIEPDPCTMIDDGDTCLKEVEVTVAWTDRDGNSQDMALSSEVFVRQPTQDVENLMQLVNAYSLSGDGYDWDDGSTGGGEDSGNENGDDPGEGDTGGDNGGDNGDPDQSPATYACECQYKNNPGYTLESGGGCCSVDGCESAVDNPPPKNNTQWEYTCVVP